MATLDQITQIAAAVGQIGIGAVALKAVRELRTAVNTLTEKFGNHENRISKLEDK